MRSLINTLGTQDFPRLRIGIDRPPARVDPAEYVLQPFAEEDQELLAEALDRTVAAIECWLAEGVVAAMDRFNRSPLISERIDQENGE